MEKMKFKCTLLSDVIISQSSSTEGNQYCLDFIPGNNFLGIVASYIYNKVDALKVFHSGLVRFGDANPSSDGKTRGLKVPNAMFYPKLKKASEECYIYHLIPHLDSDEIKRLQLKQCREGFYIFGENKGTAISFDKNFAIKSAYDSVKRRSEDGKLFGYQSLPEGLVLYFDIESDLDETINKHIFDAICGTRNIGHSRTAQYGLVKIEEANYKEVDSTPNTFSKDGKQYATVYADGRLIFLDENGEPTFRPSAKDLGFQGKDDKIDWSKSQIRTFQYSPWNGKRHTYDTDRCGIEKGSVFVVECTSSPSESVYIGNYKNEGFGKVIYNPAFLDGKSDGKANYILEDASGNDIPQDTEATCDTPLFKFLKKQQAEAERTQDLYRDVNTFIKDNKSRFIGELFASQWGSIRNIAMIVPEEAEIPMAILAFLNHGVAKAKWEERGRKEALAEFMKTTDNIRDRIINLASEMGKKCRKEEKKQ